MKLSAEQFYKWHSYLLEMQLEEQKLKLAESKHQQMEKEIEILKLKSMLYKNNLQQYRVKFSEAKKSYDDVRENLEKEIGVSLKDCTINPITFEVVDLKEPVIL